MPAEAPSPAHAAPRSPTVAAILLAAGTSRRMGRNKLLLELDGEAIVRRSARAALGAGLSPVIAVLGHQADRVRLALGGLPLAFATSADPTGPTSASLHRGLEQLPDTVEATVVLLADMVWVTDAMLAQMVEVHRRAGAAVVASRYGDVIAPPFLFARELFTELRARAEEGVGRAVVARHAQRAAFLDWPPAALADVDTPADLQAARAALGPDKPAR